MSKRHSYRIQNVKVLHCNFRHLCNSSHSRVQNVLFLWWPKLTPCSKRPQGGFKPWAWMRHALYQESYSSALLKIHTRSSNLGIWAYLMKVGWPNHETERKLINSSSDKVHDSCGLLRLRTRVKNLAVAFAAQSQNFDCWMPVTEV